MPPPRKPTIVLEASGAFDHDPQRRKDRENEPVPTGLLGDAPTNMSKSQKAMWDEFKSEIPPGVAADCDRTLFEIAVKLRTKVRAGKASTGEFGHLITCLREMGMTPVTRSKVRAQVTKERDDWAELDEVAQEVAQ